MAAPSPPNASTSLAPTTTVVSSVPLIHSNGMSLTDHTRPTSAAAPTQSFTEMMKEIDTLNDTFHRRRGDVPDVSTVPIIPLTALDHRWSHKLELEWGAYAFFRITLPKKKSVQHVHRAAGVDLVTPRNTQAATIVVENITKALFFYFKSIGGSVEVYVSSSENQKRPTKVEHMWSLERGSKEFSITSKSEPKFNENASVYYIGITCHPASGGFDDASPVAVSHSAKKGNSKENHSTTIIMKIFASKDERDETGDTSGGGSGDGDDRGFAHDHISSLSYQQKDKTIQGKIKSKLKSLKESPKNYTLFQESIRDIINHRMLEDARYQQTNFDPNFEWINKTYTKVGLHANKKLKAALHKTVIRPVHLLPTPPPGETTTSLTHEESKKSSPPGSPFPKSITNSPVTPMKKLSLHTATTEVDEESLRILSPATSMPTSPLSGVGATSSSHQHHHQHQHPPLPLQSPQAAIVGQYSALVTRVKEFSFNSSKRSKKANETVNGGLVPATPYSTFGQNLGAVTPASAVQLVSIHLKEQRERDKAAAAVTASTPNATTTGASATIVPFTTASIAEGKEGIVNTGSLTARSADPSTAPTFFLPRPPSVNSSLLNESPTYRDSESTSGEVVGDFTLPFALDAPPLSQTLAQGKKNKEKDKEAAAQKETTVEVSTTASATSSRNGRRKVTAANSASSSASASMKNTAAAAANTGSLSHKNSEKNGAAALLISTNDEKTPVAAGGVSTISSLQSSTEYASPFERFKFTDASGPLSPIHDAPHGFEPTAPSVPLTDDERIKAIIETDVSLDDILQARYKKGFRPRPSTSNSSPSATAATFDSSLSPLSPRSPIPPHHHTSLSQPNNGSRLSTPLLKSGGGAVHNRSFTNTSSIRSPSRVDSRASSRSPTKRPQSPLQLRVPLGAPPRNALTREKELIPGLDMAAAVEIMRREVKQEKHQLSETSRMLAESEAAKVAQQHTIDVLAASMGQVSRAAKARLALYAAKHGGSIGGESGDKKKETDEKEEQKAAKEKEEASTAAAKKRRSATREDRSDGSRSSDDDDDETSTSASEQSTPQRKVELIAAAPTVSVNNSSIQHSPLAPILPIEPLAEDSPQNRAREALTMTMRQSVTADLHSARKALNSSLRARQRLMGTAGRRTALKGKLGDGAMKVGVSFRDKSDPSSWVAGVFAIRNSSMSIDPEIKGIREAMIGMSQLPTKRQDRTHIYGFLASHHAHEQSIGPDGARVIPPERTSLSAMSKRELLLEIHQSRTTTPATGSQTSRPHSSGTMAFSSRSGSATSRPSTRGSPSSKSKIRKHKLASMRKSLEFAKENEHTLNTLNLEAEEGEEAAHIDEEEEVAKSAPIDPFPQPQSKDQRPSQPNSPSLPPSQSPSQPHSPALSASSSSKFSPKTGKPLTMEEKFLLHQQQHQTHTPSPIPPEVITEGENENATPTPKRETESPSAASPVPPRSGRHKSSVSFSGLATVLSEENLHEALLNDVDRDNESTPSTRSASAASGSATASRETSQPVSPMSRSPALTASTEPSSSYSSSRSQSGTSSFTASPVLAPASPNASNPSSRPLSSTPLSVNPSAASTSGHSHAPAPSPRGSPSHHSDPHIPAPFVAPVNCDILMHLRSSTWWARFHPTWNSLPTDPISLMAILIDWARGFQPSFERAVDSLESSLLSALLQMSPGQTINHHLLEAKTQHFFHEWTRASSSLNKARLGIPIDSSDNADEIHRHVATLKFIPDPHPLRLTNIWISQRRLRAKWAWMDRQLYALLVAARNRVAEFAWEIKELAARMALEHDRRNQRRQYDANKKKGHLLPVVPALLPTEQAQLSSRRKTPSSPKKSHVRDYDRSRYEAAGGGKSDGERSAGEEEAAAAVEISKPASWGMRAFTPAFVDLPSRPVSTVMERVRTARAAEKAKKLAARQKRKQAKARQLASAIAAANAESDEEQQSNSDEDDPFPPNPNSHRDDGADSDHSNMSSLAPTPLPGAGRSGSSVDKHDSNMSSSSHTPHPPASAAPLSPSHSNVWSDPANSIGASKWARFMAPPESLNGKKKPVFALPIRMMMGKASMADVVTAAVARNTVAAAAEAVAIGSTGIAFPSKSDAVATEEEKGVELRRQRQIELAKRSDTYREILAEGKTERQNLLAKMTRREQNRALVRRGFSIQFQNQMAPLVNPLPDALSLSSRHDTEPSQASVYEESRRARQFGDEPLNMYLPSAAGPTGRQLNIYERDIMRRKYKEQRLQARTAAAREKAAAQVFGLARDSNERAEKKPVYADQEEATMGLFHPGEDPHELEGQFEDDEDNAADLDEHGNSRSGSRNAHGLANLQLPRSSARNRQQEARTFAAYRSLPLSLLSPAIRAAQFEGFHPSSRLQRHPIADIDSSTLIGQFKYLSLEEWKRQR